MKEILKVLRDPGGAILALVWTPWAFVYQLFHGDEAPKGLERSVEEVTKQLDL